MNNTTKCFIVAMGCFIVALAGCGGGGPDSPVDADGDGIPASSDACPLSSETFNGYQDDDGCPDTVTGDSDSDGIPNSSDQCPADPETQNGYQDSDGCPDTAPPPPPSVDSGFTGVWRGPTTLTAPGQNPVVYNGSISLVASGQTLTASAFCPDGTGSMTMTGSGRALQWSGSYTCAYASTACAATTLTYTSATFTLNSASSMTLSAAGVLAGCGQSFNVATTMNGGR